MRVLFWYCDNFGWSPSIETLADAPDAVANAHENVVVAFIHVEPKDVEGNNAAETKLVKNAIEIPLIESLSQRKKKRKNDRYHQR